MDTKITLTGIVETLHENNGYDVGNQYLRRIAKIKALREATRSDVFVMGLKEAKDIIDALIFENIHYTCTVQNRAPLVELSKAGVVFEIVDDNQFLDMYSTEYILKAVLKRLVDNNEFKKVRVLATALEHKAFNN